MHHPVGRHLLVAGTRHTIIGIRPDTDAAARSEDARHLNIFGLHQTYQVLHDDIHAVLMEVPVIAEGEEIKLQALALHHSLCRNITYAYLGKVGLAGNGTQTGKLRTIETYPIIVVGMLIVLLTDFG